MTFTPGGCRDLRKFMNDDKVIDAFSKLISGKSGYRTVFERRQEPIICKNCKMQLSGEEKFCPECGTKVEKKEEDKIENKEG
jgi:rRNA maturation endonuclease Nob1